MILKSRLQESPLHKLMLYYLPEKQSTRTPLQMSQTQIKSQTRANILLDIKIS